MKEKVGVRTKQIEDSTNNQLRKIRHQAIDFYCLDIHIKEFEKKKLQQQKEVIWPSNNLLGGMNSMWSSHLISLLRGKTIQPGVDKWDDMSIASETIHSMLWLRRLKIKIISPPTYQLLVVGCQHISRLMWCAGPFHFYRPSRRGNPYSGS